MYIHCWYLDISELNNEEKCMRALASLPWDERRQKAESIHFQKDRLLHIGAGLLAAHALCEAGARDLCLGCGSHGKLYLMRHPDIHFNLSHSGTLAVCAVSDSPVGVDVERMRTVHWKVARRFFTSSELAWLESAPDQNLAFTRLWTRKESFLKLIGTGLARPLSSFDAVPPDTPPQTGGSGRKQSRIHTSGAEVRAGQATDPSAGSSVRDGRDIQEYSPAAVTYIEYEADGHRICVCTGMHVTPDDTERNSTHDTLREPDIRLIRWVPDL